MRVATICVAISLAFTACAAEHTQPDFRCERHDQLPTNVVPGDDAEIAPASSDPPLGGICDGSDQIRLVVASDDGPGALQAWTWRDRLGRPLLIVDGQCHYYAVGAAFGPMTQGYLNPETLRELTRDLALDDLSSLPSRRDDCADHWSDRLLATQDYSLRCRCDDCGEGTRSTLAIQNAVKWLETLASAGRPVTGVLGALALPDEPVENVGLKRQTVLDWPFDIGIEETSGLVGEYRGTSLGTYFSGFEAAALRELRTNWSKMVLSEELGLKPYVLYVTDCGKTYSLNLRDELPARIETELDAFLAVAWKRPKIPSCLQFSGNGLATSPCPL